MIRHITIALAMFTLLPRSAVANDDSDAVVTTNYRHLTVSADALGIGLLVGGGLAEGENGRDTQLSNTLFATGYLSASLATPIIHFARGHRGRAVGSFLLRQGLAGAGMLLAMESQRGCDGFLCELDYVGYGVLGGLITASMIDAALMTEEHAPRERGTWAPTISASHQGARVGIVAEF